MRGRHAVRVENARVQFKLEVARNLTVIRGMSATGKTTLVGLVAEHERQGEASGVSLSCDKPCVTLSGRAWEAQLAEIHDSIVFIDEDCEFVTSNDFARAVRESDNYYVIVSREDLPALPYSVEEVYELRNTTSRYPNVRKYYTHAQRMYAEIPGVSDPQVVIVEDSNAGYEFFAALCERSGIACISAHGKARVLAELEGCQADRILVIADGAAFGPQMDRVLALAKRKGAGLFLPESFEWLLLSSGLVKDSEIPEVLADPGAFIESRDHFSWERFFNALLVEKTRGTYLHYTKDHLNPVYLQDHERTAITEQLAGTGLDVR